MAFTSFFALSRISTRHVSGPSLRRLCVSRLFHHPLPGSSQASGEIRLGSGFSPWHPSAYCEKVFSLSPVLHCRIARSSSSIVASRDSLAALAAPAEL